MELNRRWPRFVLLLLVLGGACRPVPEMRGPQELDEAYEGLLHKWTRSGDVYHSLDGVMVVHATYLSPEFRQAFGTQYLKIFGIDPGKVDTDLEMIATSIGRGHEFFLFADMNKYGWNNLDERDSVWRLGLWGGDDQPGVPPQKLVRFRGRGPNLQAFFPFLNDFGRSYLVMFPMDQPNGQPVLAAPGGTLRLRLASAFGSAELVWKVNE